MYQAQQRCFPKIVGDVLEKYVYCRSCDAPASICLPDPDSSHTKYTSVCATESMSLHRLYQVALFISYIHYQGHLAG